MVCIHTPYVALFVVLTMLRFSLVIMLGVETISMLGEA
jgi:hypothetical protein